MFMLDNDVGNLSVQEIGALECTRSLITPDKYIKKILNPLHTIHRYFNTFISNLQWLQQAELPSTMLFTLACYAKYTWLNRCSEQRMGSRRDPDAVCCSSHCSDGVIAFPVKISWLLYPVQCVGSIVIGMQPLAESGRPISHNDNSDSDSLWPISSLQCFYITIWYHLSSLDTRYRVLSTTSAWWKTKKKKKKWVE